MRMVLPDRIELSTSPLPRECSTTELRQHGVGQLPARSARKLPQGVAGCKESPRPASRARLAAVTSLSRPLGLPHPASSPQITGMTHRRSEEDQERLAAALRANLGAAQGPGASAPGKVSRVSARKVSRVSARKATCGSAEPNWGRPKARRNPARRGGDPRFRRICRGQAVKVNGSGVRPRPVRLRPSAGARMNRRCGYAD